eukprot:1297763-Prymnesium_polylepis.1
MGGVGGKGGGRLVALTAAVWGLNLFGALLAAALYGGLAASPAAPTNLTAVEPTGSLMAPPLWADGH